MLWFEAEYEVEVLVMLGVKDYASAYVRSGREFMMLEMIPFFIYCLSKAYETLKRSFFYIRLMSRSFTLDSTMYTLHLQPRVAAYARSW